MAPTGKNVDDFCRLCAVEAKNGIIIYSTEGLHLCLEEKIIQCLRIEVSKDDMLPKKICHPCRTRLEDSHRFVEQANRVQHTLELLVQMKHIDHQSAKIGQKSFSDIGVKLEDELHIKNEVEDLPLDVTLDSDTDNQLETKAVDSSDESSTAGRNIKQVSGSEGDQAEKSEAFTRRRKMLQPKRKNFHSSVKRRGRPRRNPHCNLSTCSETERLVGISDEDAIENEEQNIIEMKEKSKENTNSDVESDITKDVKEGPEDREDEEEEEDEEEDESNKSAKEEWKTHWGIKCNQCDQIFPFRSQFDKHYRNTYDKKPIYTCSYCSKTMEKYSTFRSHCYRHVTEGRYRCEYCQKGFSLRSMLHVHILAKHTTVKPFICEECGKGFVTRPGLNIHLKKHKTDEKLEYPCSDCGKILHTRGGLTAHQNVHKLGRRFMCDVCGKTFTQKVNMQQHVKHHTGERPFACEKCGKCFAEKSHLNRHYSFHSEKRPFQCTVCLKMYKTERCLKVHAMVHAEARPYVCTYCNKGFLSTTKLKQHYNIHTGERPYACKFCERTFTNYPNWLKHTRRRHKADPRSGTLPVRGVSQVSPQVHEQLDQQQLQCSLQQQQLQEQQHVPHPLTSLNSPNTHDSMQEEERVSVITQSSHTPTHLVAACIIPDNGSSTIGMLSQYSHSGHQSQTHHSQTVPSQAQPHPTHQASQAHSHSIPQSHQQTLPQSGTLSLSQVYSEHMILPMPHHHILPL